MFEPENQIERDLIRAAVDPGARPHFLRSLLGTEVFVVLVPHGDRALLEGSGKATIAADTTLVLATAARGSDHLVPFFTAVSRARTWHVGEHIVAPVRVRDLFEKDARATYVLNPGSDYGKEFLPAEVARMLAGQIDGEVTIPRDTKILLGRPKDQPTELIACLRKELKTVKSVTGAWLMLASIEGLPEQSWMLGVEQTGDWKQVQEAISRAAAGGVLAGKILDAVPLKDSPLAKTLRTGIPILAAEKRGLLNNFFR